MLFDHLDRFVEPGPDALVFTNGAGQPLSHSSFQTHHFRKAQVAAGVSCRFHDLRHTSVALAIVEHLDTTPATASGLFDKLASLGVAEEVMGRKRNRVYRYSPYLELFTSDDERSAGTRPDADEPGRGGHA